MIELSDVSVTLGGRPVVQAARFAAQAGALTAILGPNGSGKTSTLKALSGDYRYTGQIHINGRDLAGLTTREQARLRGVLSQSIHLGFPFLVREVLEMGIAAGDVTSRKEADRVIASALAAVDLSGFESRVATALSGGEQSRMHMARVLCQIHAPRLDGVARWLFLDEPVASLDVRHQMTLMQTARSFAQRGGGVLAVMHDLNLTAMFADHVVMFRQGQVIAEGAPDAVFEEKLLAEVYGFPLEVQRREGRMWIMPRRDAA